METFLNNLIYLFVKDCLTFILTVLGLVIASMGLVTWRKQIKGTKEFEIAYNLNYAVLKLRDAIKHVRNPAIWPSEGSRAIQYARAKYPEKIADELKIDSRVYVYEMGGNFKSTNQGGFFPAGCRSIVGNRNCSEEKSY